jgi:hypothetical protein
MEIVEFNVEKHYPMVCKWWDQHEWPSIAPSMLPKNGRIVEGVAAAWLYLTDSGLCLMEWYISNKEASREDRGEAVDGIIGELIEVAKKNGASIILSSVMIPRLRKRLEAQGFIVTDTRMTNLARIL